jgi:hypothetical protein
MSNQAQAPEQGQFSGGPGTGSPQPEGNFNGDPSAAMTAFGQEVRTQLTEQGERVEALGGNVVEFTGRIEAVETRFQEWQQSEAARFQTLMEGGRFAEVAEQLQALETQVARLGQLGTAPPASAVLPFQAHFDSPGFRGWVAAGMPKGKEGSGRTVIPHLLQRNGRFSGRQSGAFAVDIDESLVGVLDEHYLRPGVIELLRDRIGLMDVVNIVPQISSQHYDYLIETAESQTAVVGTKLAADIDGDPTPKTTCTVENSEGFTPGVAVLFYTSGGVESKVLVSKDDPTGVLTFATDDLDFDAATGDKVTTEEMLATEEAALKPAGYLAVEEETVKLQTIATWVRTTRQRLQYSNAANLAAWIDGRLPVRWRESMEWHLLRGSGSNGQLHGFLNAGILPAGQTDQWTDLNLGDTRADLILWSGTQIPGEPRIVCVLNKLDWFKIINYKASDGHYVQNLAEGPRVINTPGLKAVGDIQVVLSRKVLEHEGLVFAPDFASEVVPGASEMWTGYVNDDRIRNKETHLYEADAANAITDTQAFRKLDFSTGAPT